MQKIQNNKVDVIIPFFTPPFLGGTETVIRSWVKNLKKVNEVNVRFINAFNYKNDNFLADVDNSNRISYKGITNKRSIVRNIGMFFLICYYIQTDAQEIIVLSPKYIKLASLIRKLFHKKYKIISWVHFSLNRMFKDDGNIFLLADHHLAISTGIAKQLEGFGISRDEISVIYNPIEKNKKTIGTTLNPRFVYIGRIEIEHQKNLIEMLKAFQFFSINYHNAVLEIWGDGEDKNELQKIVRKMGLNGKVNFHGWSKNPWAEVDDATAMLLTSTFEGLPMSILESISRGLPVISSNIETGPVDEICDENGRLYSLGKIKELEAEMEYIYENPQNFSRDNVKKSINKFYTEIYYKNVIDILKKEN